MKPLLLSILACSLFSLALRAVPAVSAEAARPLAAGAQVPNVEVRTADDLPLDLGAAVKGKPTILIFYRGGWCPYCNVHLGELQTLEPKLKALGFQILALSTDAPAGLAPTVEKHHLSYQLLSDRQMKAAEAFGVAYKVKPELYARYAGLKIELASVPGEPDAHWLVVPSAFVISRDGVVRFVHSDPDYKKRVNSEELLKAAEAAAQSN